MRLVTVAFWINVASVVANSVACVVCPPDLWASHFLIAVSSAALALVLLHIPPAPKGKQ